MTSEKETTEKKKILVVDDENILRMTARQLLECSGYLVEEADSGEDVANMVLEHGIDLVLLDLNMPRMCGMETLQALKSNPETASVPVLIITGVPTDTREVEGLDAGAADFIAKPFSMEILLARVRAHLRLKMQEDELDRRRAAAEEKNVLLTIKNAELANLLEFKADVLTPMGDPAHGKMMELLNLIDRVSENNELPEDLKVNIDGLVELAPSIQQVLRIQEYHRRADELLRGKSVLVLDSTPIPRRLAERTIFATGASVRAVTSTTAALDHLRSTPTDALFVDWENADVLPDAMKIRPDLQAVLMTSQPIFEKAGDQMLKLPLASVYITNVLARTAANDPIAVKEILTTTGKLLSENIFGLEKYLGWGAAINEETITNSEVRHDTIDRIFEFSMEAGLRKKFAQQVQTVVDELIMNAIWDAPVDEDGEPKYYHQPRNEPVELLPEEAVRVRYGSDANSFGVSVTDHFGRLEYDRAVRYLVKCFASKEDQVRLEKEGAGIGLFMAYNSVSSFVINVDPGKRTEVIGLIHLNRTGPSQSAQTRSFCYFRKTPQLRLD